MVSRLERGCLWVAVLAALLLGWISVWADADELTGWRTCPWGRPKIARPELSEPVESTGLRSTWCHSVWWATGRCPDQNPLGNPPMVCCHDHNKDGWIGD